jgi:hypothetical protein
MMNHNFNETDIKGDNIVHYILKIRLLLNKGSYIIENKLFPASGWITTVH